MCTFFSLNNVYQVSLVASERLLFIVHLLRKHGDEWYVRL